LETQYKVLLVEDTEEVRLAVSDLIEMNGFECITAKNGKEGLEKAEEDEPDVIISDVMMPVMDGFEFARSVTETPSLSHIPIIMLTAKVEEQDMIEGLELGAVDYITKPFNSTELMLKIRNIIKRRELFRQNNWQAMMAESLDQEPENEDQRFLRTLHEHISSNIDNSNFGVSELSHLMMVSERNLYRRVKELTGEPVASLVREVRLQYAHKLITNKKVKTISEAAFKVGFKSPKHFSRAYKQRFPQ
jgi:DNA-binding response OmpR family regulator